MIFSSELIHNCFVIRPIRSGPANSVRRGELPRLYLWLQQLVLSVQLGLNNTRLLVPVQYLLYSSSGNNWTVQAAAGHKSSGNTRRWWMAASGRAGGCSGAPPDCCTGSVERFNWNTVRTKISITFLTFYTFSEY